MVDPRYSSSPSGDPHSVAEADVTRVVNVGRVRPPSGDSALAPVRPSALIAEQGRRPAVAGRFLITGEIARGGMGIIYRGHDPELGRDLAIKVLKPEWVDQPDVVAMFLEEARICGRLQHPGIVPIHEVGTMIDGSPFIAMKLVEGRTFARVLAERGRSAHELQRVLRIFDGVCQTLAYAHSRGVVHRDLKPSNIMVGPFGEVQVMDWGLACQAAGEGGRGGGESAAGSVMGTPAYMAPEQARGSAAPDVRVDVFALGAILCEILTGSPPFRGGDGGTVGRAADGETQPAINRLHDEGLDPDLVAPRLPVPVGRSGPATRQRGPTRGGDQRPPGRRPGAVASGRIAAGRRRGAGRRRAPLAAALRRGGPTSPRRRRRLDRAGRSRALPSARRRYRPHDPRYARAEAAAIWSPQTRFRIMFEIEAHAADAMAELGVIPKLAAEAIWERGGDVVFDVDRIDEIERETKHDVIAFLTHVTEIVGPEARFLHQGMTSSDVNDTALAVQLSAGRRTC